MKPLVSILTPCYNCEKWLSETIDSALAQTWENIEVIVVDDGSTDDSLAIAKRYESNLVKVISQTNQGASAARNVAYRSSAGEFIQYLDADDVLAPDKIERQVDILQNSPKMLTTCEWARFRHKIEEAQFTPQALWQDLEPVDFLIKAWENHLMMHPAAWLVPRSLAEKAGYWDETLSLNDDGEYFARVVLASQGIKFCWGAKTYYRSGNSGSLSGSKSDSAWKSAFHSLELGTHNLLACENTPRTRRVCATVFQRLIYEMYPNQLDLQLKAGAMVEKLGGSDINPMGGSLFQGIAAIVGWKSAKRLQRILYQIGYKRIASTRM
jgi:glycosyltransferase involved in cell wall biosynthesis